MGMKMFILLETQPYVHFDENEDEVTDYFDETKLDHALVTFKSNTIGKYDWVAYLTDVTVEQALAVVDTLANDPTIATFTPLLELSLSP